jgi:hypothetical protein
VLLLIVALAACSPEQAIRQAFALRGAAPVEQEHAVTIATCESRLDPGARSGPYHGLFQIHVGSDAQGPRVARLGLTVADLMNPWWNAVVAADLWRDLGRFGSTAGWGNCARKAGIR